MSKPDHPFIIIPGAILDRADLSHPEKIIFGCIHSATMGTAHKCFLTNEELARRTAMHVNHVRRVLLSLEKARLIKRRYSKDCHRSKIDVTWRGASVIIKETSDEGVPLRVAGGAPRVAGGATQSSTPASLDNTPDINPPYPPETGGRVGGLLGRAKEVGLAGATAVKVQAAVDQFGADRVGRAIDSAAGKAERWGWVVAALKRWDSSGVAPFVAKREPKRPEDLPAPRPPPPADDAIDGSEVAARLRGLIRDPPKNLAGRS